MRVSQILPLVAMIACTFPVFASAADNAPAQEWDKVLDGIYSHTWRGRTDLSDEVKKQESRIRQDLPDYITAWERRMAAPAVSIGKETGGDGCGPLRYCAADFLDTRGFITKLREKKEPMARSLFEKLSPVARKTVLGVGPRCRSAACPGQPDPGRRSDEDCEPGHLLRVGSSWRDEPFSGDHCAGSGSNSAMNRVCINKTIIAEAFPAELARNFKCVLQKDESYRRVVSAKTVQYLRTGDKKTLDEAIALSDTFANKLMYTDFAFWYYYPRALADIENGNSSALQSDAYKLLNEVVLWEEPWKQAIPLR